MLEGYYVTIFPENCFKKYDPLALANQMLGPDKKFFNVDYNKGIGRLYVYLHGCSQQVTV